MCHNRMSHSKITSLILTVTCIRRNCVTRTQLRIVEIKKEVTDTGSPSSSKSIQIQRPAWAHFTQTPFPSTSGSPDIFSSTKVRGLHGSKFRILPVPVREAFGPTTKLSFKRVTVTKGSQTATLFYHLLRQSCH